MTNFSPKEKFNGLYTYVKLYIIFHLLVIGCEFSSLFVTIEGISGGIQGWTNVDQEREIYTVVGWKILMTKEEKEMSKWWIHR